MSLLLAFLLLAVCSATLTLVHGLRHAPEAYEDHDGFHYGPEPMKRAAVRRPVRAQVRRFEPVAH